ncbi:unnamed protein product [Psylliodes chrysocephalus]|uniref:Major facilitator superfamily (MFS) profile domain-containing protein n=1 Tax=Psylliodes chrysocephalus TaxID=3402493 RepID=A0A9P0CTU1_9CUCU|nr:unnamed protein product [Psylliodes chrysocephala]
MRMQNIENGENQNVEDTKPKESDESTFEDAITATGFGKYNYVLLFIISVPCIAQLVNTVELSYVLPVAACDLDLSLEDKGVLNAVMFAGMIVSGPFWGYFCDALGRKQIIVYGYFITGVFAITAALCTNKTVLIAAKLLSGVFINGPFTATASHLAEFHSSKYRGKVNMARGIFISVGNLLLPVLAWAILPRKWNFSVFGIFDIHSWNIFLLVCASTTVLSGFFYIFLPESPKFLMTSGRNEEALAVLQKMYKLNTGNSKNTFPIKRLVEETKDDNTRNNKVGEVGAALKKGCLEMGNILHRPHIFYLALACFNAFSLIMSSNTLKLWLPGIFQAISDYQHNHNDTSNDICIMLEELNPQSHNDSSLENCSVNMDNLSVYINTFIVAATRIGAFAVSEMFVNLLGVKTLTIVTCFLSSGLLTSIYFARSSEAVTVLSAIGTATGSVAENLLVTLTLELFPTSLRTIALSIHLTSGRAGTLVGNIIFPYLLHLGCLPPFVFIGVFGAACGVFSFFYSSVENKPLQ